MPQLIYLVLCQKTPFKSSGKYDHSRTYKTILGAYEQVAAANAAVESHFNRFIMNHQSDIEGCAVLCGGIDKLSSATVTTDEAEYGWAIHAEILRKDSGSVI